MTHRIRMRVLRPLAVLAVTLAMIVPAFSAAPGASRQNAGAQTAGAQAAAAPEAATVKREMNDFERNLDRSLRQLFGNRPFGILQEAKASYLPGYGALVHAELNLYSLPVSPMIIRYSEEELRTEHEQKVVMLGKLRTWMCEMLLEQAPKLGASENAAIILHFFNLRPYPDVPSQMVATANVKALASFEGRKVPMAELQKVVTLREF